MNSSIKFILVIVAIIVAVSWYKYENRGTGEVVADPVTSQFSPVDGSHAQLIDIVKKQMDNPASFEHVKTSYIITDDNRILVYMEYYGTNALGAKVLNKVRGKFSKEGFYLGEVK